MAAVEAADTSVAAGAEDISAGEPPDLATAWAVRALPRLAAIVAELLRAPMAPTEQRDRALTVGGPMAVRLTVRDTLAHMAAGLRRPRQVHATVQLRLIEPIRQRLRGVTAPLALPLTAARLIAARQLGLHRRPIAATLRRPGRQVEWSLPIDRALL